MRAGVCLSVNFYTSIKSCINSGFFSLQYICGSNETFTRLQYKVAGAQNCGFGRALIAGDTAYLLSDNTDLQPVRDGENFNLLYNI